MRQVPFVAAACAATLAGCSLVTTDVIYSPRLIHDVGAGSMALMNMSTTLDIHRLAKSGAVVTPAANRAAELLFRGQLNQLGQSGATEIESVINAGARRTKALVDTIRAAQRAITDAELNASSYGLSAGATQFVDEWNAYLAAEQARAGRALQAFIVILPYFGEMRRLLAAARDTARLRSTAIFDRVRRRFFVRLQSQADAFQRLMGSIFPNNTYQPFIRYAKSNVDARLIVTAVNRQTPGGLLARVQPTR